MADSVPPPPPPTRYTKSPPLPSTNDGLEVFNVQYVFFEFVEQGVAVETAL